MHIELPPSYLHQPSSDPPLSIPPPQARQKPAPPAGLAVQSFAAFRAQTPSLPAPSPVRRKPLPANSSQTTARFHSIDHTDTARAAERATVQRPVSLDSPPPPDLQRVEPVLSPLLSCTQEVFAPRDLDKYVAEAWNTQSMHANFLQKSPWEHAIGSPGDVHGYRHATLRPTKRFEVLRATP